MVRGAHHGESHGGIYLIDFHRGAELKLDWNRSDIDFSGRGGDRGLRGIAFHHEFILIAANSQLLKFNREFRLIESFTNPYLRHCHEITIANGRVYLTATGFDSLLSFDLAEGRFLDGWHLGVEANSLRLRRYDPCGGPGPAEGHRFHINSVAASTAGIWFSGLYTPGLLYTDGGSLSLVEPLPQGTHNARTHEGGVLYNDTASDRVCYRINGHTVAIAVPDYPAERIVNLDRFASQVARPRFARGLCALGPTVIAAGSSPSTVAVYDLRTGTHVAQMNLSMDVRNAIHGLAVWPFS